MNVLVAGNQVLRLVQSGFDEVKKEKKNSRKLDHWYIQLSFTPPHNTRGAYFESFVNG